MKTENKTLLKIARLLNNNFFTYFIDDTILSISEDKEVSPFAHLIIDDNFKGGVILALAVDYPDAIQAVEVALQARQISPVALGDPFYIAKDGHTYFEEEAYEKFSLDDIDLSLWDSKDAILQ